ALLLDDGCGLEDGAGLHLVDFRIGDAEPATAMAQHGIGFLEHGGAGGDMLGGHAGGLGHLLHLGTAMRQELVQRRVVAAGGGRPFMMRNSSTKSSRCIGIILASAARRPSVVSATIISRMATMRWPSKNICSVRQSPMPSAPKRRAMRASAGVSALVRTRRRRCSSAQPISLAKSPESS